MKELNHILLISISSIAMVKTINASSAHNKAAQKYTFEQIVKKYNLTDRNGNQLKPWCKSSKLYFQSKWSHVSRKNFTEQLVKGKFLSPKKNEKRFYCKLSKINKKILPLILTTQKQEILDKSFIARPSNIKNKNKKNKKFIYSLDLWRRNGRFNLEANIPVKEIRLLNDNQILNIAPNTNFVGDILSKQIKNSVIIKGKNKAPNIGSKNGEIDVLKIINKGKGDEVLLKRVFSNNVIIKGDAKFLSPEVNVKSIFLDNAKIKINSPKNILNIIGRGVVNFYKGGKIHNVGESIDLDELYNKFQEQNLYLHYPVKQVEFDKKNYILNGNIKVLEKVTFHKERKYIPLRGDISIQGDVNFVPEFWVKVRDKKIIPKYRDLLNDYSTTSKKRLEEEVNEWLEKELYKTQTFEELYKNHIFNNDCYRSDNWQLIYGGAFTSAWQEISKYNSSSDLYEFEERPSLETLLRHSNSSYKSKSQIKEIYYNNDGGIRLTEKKINLDGTLIPKSSDNIWKLKSVQILKEGAKVKLSENISTYRISLFDKDQILTIMPGTNFEGVIDGFGLVQIYGENDLGGIGGGVLLRDKENPNDISKAKKRRFGALKQIFIENDGSLRNAAKLTNPYAKTLILKGRAIIDSPMFNKIFLHEGSNLKLLNLEKREWLNINGLGDIELVGGNVTLAIGEQVPVNSIKFDDKKYVIQGYLEAIGKISFHKDGEYVPESRYSKIKGEYNFVPKHWKKVNRKLLVTEERFNEYNINNQNMFGFLNKDFIGEINIYDFPKSKERLRIALRRLNLAIEISKAKQEIQRLKLKSLMRLKERELSNRKVFSGLTRQYSDPLIKEIDKISDSFEIVPDVTIADLEPLTDVPRKNRC